MSDIVERLQAMAPDGGSGIVCNDRTTREMNADINEAAETILALRKEVDRLTANGVHTCHDQCQRVACVLRRGNGILREALNEIEHAESVEIARYLALAALASELTP